MLAELLAELAQGIPSLPGARCRGREELFDQTAAGPDWDQDGSHIRYVRSRAVALCAGCPVLDRCRDWVEGLPMGRRPVGVVGGVLTDQAGRRNRPK